LDFRVHLLNIRTHYRYHLLFGLYKDRSLFIDYLTTLIYGSLIGSLIYHM
jgi:hypothetical protein